jgi:hypothetical protein
MHRTWEDKQAAAILKEGFNKDSPHRPSRSEAAALLGASTNARFRGMCGQDASAAFAAVSSAAPKEHILMGHPHCNASETFFTTGTPDLDLMRRLIQHMQLTKCK